MGNISKALFFTAVMLASQNVFAADTLKSAGRIAASGMQAQNERLKIVTQNIANASVTGQSPNEEPYRRKVIFFKNEYNPKDKAEILKVDKISVDQSDFILKYEPNHPAADKKGYVKYPNVNQALEIVDAKEAQRSFEANLTAFEITKGNKNKIIELMR